MKLLGITNLTKIRKWGNPKQLFQSLDNVTKIKVDPLPTIFSSDLALAESFSDFFVDKVDIHIEISLMSNSTKQLLLGISPVFVQFDAIAPNDVPKLHQF